MPVTLSDSNIVLLVVGLILLVINIIIGVLQIRRGRIQTGLFSVALALVACVLIMIAVVRISTTIPSTVANAGNTASTGSPARLLTPDEFLPLVTAAGAGILVIIAGIVLYRAERRKEDFDPRRSSGLLNSAAGTLILVAALAIPTIPLQQAGVHLRALGAVSSATSTGSAPTRTVAITPTATMTLTPSDTPTLLPSLTPTESETPIILYTPIAYSSTYAAGTQTPCTVTAKTTLSLRADPSVNQQSIGRVFAGSLLNVTGRSADKKWWYVLNSDGGINITGWVSAAYVDADSNCTDQAVPVVSDIGNTLTPSPVASAAQPTTGSPTTSAANNVTTAPCTLLTTTAVNLRPDPSRTHEPLASIPERTALVALGKSADGQWWHIAYGSADGWIGAGSVITSASCSGVPTVTPAS